MRFSWICVWFLFCSSSFSQSAPTISKEGQQCLECHNNSTPGAVEQWRGSAHAKAGVDCYSCHQANPGDPAAFEHYGLKIAVIVTPYYCARCHKSETDQFEKSRHANAAQFIGSLDNVLGEVVEGGPAAMNGCRQCHGSTVKYTGDGKFDFSTWPNSGIGRVNPDGTREAAPPATGDIPSARRWLASRRTAASVTWVPTIPRQRSTPSPSTASSSAATSPR